MTAATPRAGGDTEPRGERARGRELALLALCHLESYPQAEAVELLEAVQLLWRHPPHGEGERGLLLRNLVREEPTRRRADALLRGLLPLRTEVDGNISQTSARWRLDRMDQIDRNVLRLATFELSARPRTPRPVILSEAVRLARRYGSERSPSFVNGLADALARRLRPPEAERAASPIDEGELPPAEGDG